MKYKALCSFSGNISMYEGEVRDLDKSLAFEYVKCGFLEEVADKKKKAVKPKETK